MQSFGHKFPHATWAVSLSRWQTSEQFHRKMQLHRFCWAHLKGSDIKCPSCPCVMAQQLLVHVSSASTSTTGDLSSYCLSRETLQFWMTTAAACENKQSQFFFAFLCTWDRTQQTLSSFAWVLTDTTSMLHTMSILRWFGSHRVNIQSLACVEFC